ncbi:MAG: EAL domain-containing protein [Pseudomonadota bacterium]
MTRVRGSIFRKPNKGFDLFKTVDLTPEQSAGFMAAQVEDIQRLATITILAAYLNLFVLVLSFWETDLGRLVMSWGGIMALVLFYMLAAQRLTRHKTWTRDNDKKRLQKFTRGATSIGILWGFVPVLVLPFSDSIGVTAVGMLLTGTMFGGVLLIGRVPQAAMGLVTPIVIGILVALQLQQDPRNSLLSVMTLAYAGVLYFASRLAYTQFLHQFVDRESLAEKSEVIGLLLKDFEENTSDWLWQTDADGQVTTLPTEFDHQTSTETPIEVGEQFLSRFDPDAAYESISESMTQKTPFRDVTLRLETDDGDQRWLNLSGKPLFHKGEFCGYRGVASDITEAKNSEDRIAFMAHYDTLTGLPNRGQLTERITGLRGRGESEDYALVWMDLDNFKWVNDTLGHDSGDEILKAVADRLQSVQPEPLMAARISGDEFALLMRYKTYEDLCAQMDRLTARLAEPYDVWGSTVLCRASLGVKTIPHGRFDTETTMKHADLALHHAKEHERGTWCLFDQKLAERVKSLRELELDLNNAIERDEMRLFYQPIVDAKTQTVVGLETLLRWQHPRKGLLGPGAFISFAEESGVIARLGDWVIRQALSDARQLPDHIRVAVNISPLQIHSTGLIATIVNALATNGVSADRLELEITESVMISDAEFTMQRLTQLKDIGVRIALDDFGTGFSSMSYLRQFPFDKLKIDKCFVDDVETDEDSRAIAQATLQMAKALGMRCTGEGVETPRQAEFLRENGCDELQGFMISRPLPLNKLGHLIKITEVAANDVAAGSVASVPRKPKRKRTPKAQSKSKAS